MTDTSENISPSITLQSGTFTSDNGGGAFARAIDQSGDTTTIDATRTNTNGMSWSSQTTITANADGSATRDTVSTNAQGGTTTTDVTVGALQNGVRVIAGTITMADGTVDQVNGAIFPTATGYSEYIVLTNPDGTTATGTAQVTHSGATTTTTTDGTNFQGDAFAQQGSSTVLSTVDGNAIGLLPGGGDATGGAAGMPPSATDMMGVGAAHATF